MGRASMRAGGANLDTTGPVAAKLSDGGAYSLDAVALGAQQDNRFFMNASNLSLQSQTASLTEWAEVQPGADSSRGAEKDAVSIPDIDARAATKALDPRAGVSPNGDRGAGGGGGGDGDFDNKPGALPPAAVAPATEKSAAAPGGPGTGHPAAGATPESRRDRLEVPLRVGSDEEKLREIAKNAGVDPALVTRPLPKFDEELWVIARPTPRDTPAATRQSPSPGVGTLWLGRGAGTRTASLREYKAEATIMGPVASVTVSQRFENETSETVDGVYVLPMPRYAAVTDFVMTVGSGETQRRIRGVIRERAEAERIFLDAQKQGRIASLMGEDAANVLVQRIGNVAGGASIGTSVTYFGTLDYAGIPGANGVDLANGGSGAYEFVLPMRGIAAAGCREHFVTVKIDAGLEIVGGVKSPTHEIATHVVSETGRTVTMRAPLIDGIDGDFVLRYAVAGATPRVGIVTQSVGGQNGGGTYFSMLVTPPVATGVRPSMDVVIVPDISVETTGPTLAAMKSAAAALLGRLSPSDRFAVVLGANDSLELTAATPEAVAAAIRLVGAMEYDERRSLSAAMRGALMVGRGAVGPLVCVLSRGEISEGIDVLREARAHLGASRIFAVSVDEPAGFAFESLARIGRGGVIHLSSGAGPANERLMARLLEREGSPVMTDLAIDWGGAEVVDVFPRQLPDLCPGRPVHVVGRLLSPPGSGKAISVTGTVRGMSGVRREALSAKWSAVTMTPGAIPTLWARAKVLMLAERLAAGTADAEAIRREIVDLALDHNLVSAMTAFVAVDAMSSVEPTIIEQATNVAPR
jgi:Ca-activated chloride channel family protein